MKHESRPVALAVTVFVTVAAILLFYDSLFGQRVVVNIGRQLLQAVQPILYGAFIAYLLSPMVDFFEGHLFASAVAKARSAGRISRGARAVSLILTWLVIYVLFHLLASILLPELYRSVLQLFGSAESYYNTISGWIQHLLESNPDVEHWVTQQMNTYYEDIQTWLTKEALPQATTLMTAVYVGQALCAPIMSAFLATEGGMTQNGLLGARFFTLRQLFSHAFIPPESPQVRHAGSSDS